MSFRKKAGSSAACLLLSVCSFQTSAQTAQTVERNVTPFTGGSISTPFTVSGSATTAFTITYQDGGATKTLNVSVGDKIEGLKAQSATGVKGTAQGGKLQIPPSPTVTDGTATTTLLSDVTLKDATLAAVTPVGAAQSFTAKGTAVTATLSGVIGMEKAATDKVTIDTPVVPVEALKKQTDVPLGATTQVDAGWVGDYVILNVDVRQFSLSDDPAQMRTAPQGTCFRINRQYEKDDPGEPGKKKKYVTGSFVTGWFPRWPSAMPPWHCSDSLGEIDSKLSYDVPRDIIETDRDRSRFGYTYGVLVAPFKYYRSDRQFSAGASVGPYIGHRIHDRQGSSTVVAAAIGATSATVKTQNADGTESTSTKTGMSLALALLNQFKDFNVGLIIGRDIFSKADNVPISGHNWLSISIGAKLD